MREFKITSKDMDLIKQGITSEVAMYEGQEPEPGELIKLTDGTLTQQVKVDSFYEREEDAPAYITFLKR